MWRRLALVRTALTTAQHGSSAASAAAAASASSLCCRCESVPSCVAAAVAAAVPRPSLRSFHSSALLRIQAAGGGGGGGRSRSKKLAERAEAAAKEAAQAAHDAQHTSKLKALLRARAAEDEALAAAESASVYRKPKIKRKGRAYEAREAFIAEAQGNTDLEAMLAELDETDKKQEAEARAAAAKGSDSGGKAPQFPFDPAVGPAPGSGSAQAAVAAPVVSALRSQLHYLDALPALPHNAGGIGFDSIRLDTTDVLQDEVFETRQLTPAMQQLRDDRDRKYQYQRVERVTEKTRDIVGRVLLEESIKIGEAQAVWEAQLAAYATALGHAVATGAPRPKKPKPPPAASRMDLRRTPTFQIHDVRYSTDAGHCNIMWHLGKEGFSKEVQPAETAAAATGKRKSTKPSTEAAAEPAEVVAPLASAPLGSWADSKRLVSNTLEHVARSVRFALGRELDMKYTPHVRIQYDEKFAASKEREQIEAEAEEKVRREEEQQQQEQAAAAAAGDSSSVSSSSSSLSALATAKSSLLGVDPSALDLSLSSLARSLLGLGAADGTRADLDLEREFDEGKQWRIPPRKLKAQEARRKLKEKKFEQGRKQRALLSEARKHAAGIDTRDVAPLADPYAALDPSTARNPSEMRRQLKATMAALVSGARPDRSPERLQKLRDSRASLTMLNQIQALHRKLEINPVQELKKSMARSATKQYPKDWRNMKEQFYKR